MLNRRMILVSDAQNTGQHRVITSSGATGNYLNLFAKEFFKITKTLNFLLKWRATPYLMEKLKPSTPPATRPHIIL